MVRSAAKNFEDVAIVTSVDDYASLAEEMKATRRPYPGDALAPGADRPLLSPRLTTPRLPTRWSASPATKPAHDPVQFMEPETTPFPDALRIAYPLAMDLRYGENPHQRAALYSDGSGNGIAGATQLHGKELSYNNLVDLDACWDLVQEFDEPAVAIIKHTNPCGAANAATLVEAYDKALACDPSRPSAASSA